MAYFTPLPQPNQVISVQINENYSCEIAKYNGSCGEYYKFNEVYYDIRFPIDWVFQTPNFNSDIDIDTPFGPEICFKCFECGYYNGVFIGYCTTCAAAINYERGNGLIGDGIENQGNEQKSIWNLYLQNTLLEEIGDQNLYVDYRYKMYHNDRIYNDMMDIGIQRENDDKTITYESFGYISSAGEDDITIAFSSFSDDLSEYFDDDDDDFIDIDSIS